MTDFNQEKHAKVLESLYESGDDLFDQLQKLKDHADQELLVNPFGLFPEVFVNSLDGTIPPGEQKARERETFTFTCEDEFDTQKDRLKFFDSIASALVHYNRVPTSFGFVSEGFCKVVDMEENYTPLSGDDPEVKETIVASVLTIYPRKNITCFAPVDRDGNNAILPLTWGKPSPSRSYVLETLSKVVLVRLGLALGEDLSGHYPEIFRDDSDDFNPNS